MKKIVLTLIVLLFAIAPAMAEVGFNGAGPIVLTADANDPAAGIGGNADVEIVKASNNVYGNVVSSANRFASSTLHVNGTYQYATSSEDTKIYRLSRTATYVGQTTFDQALSNSDTADFSSSSWKAL